MGLHDLGVDGFATLWYYRVPNSRRGLLHLVRVPYVYIGREPRRYRNAWRNIEALVPTIANGHLQPACGKRAQQEHWQISGAALPWGQKCATCRDIAEADNPNDRFVFAGLTTNEPALLGRITLATAYGTQNREVPFQTWKDSVLQRYERDLAITDPQF